MQQANDHLADFHRLGVAPGCDLDELKRCYRRQVQRMHPDRNPELGAGGLGPGELAELNAAYRRLIDYHRQHQRLADDRRSGFGPVRDATASRIRSAGRKRALPARSSGRGWAAFAVFGLGAAFLWLALPDGTLSGNSESPPRTSANDATVLASSAEDSPDHRAIRIGDTRLAVLHSLGPPILATPEVWEYGPSHVRFKQGHVIDWYSSPLKPIAVDEASRQDPRKTGPETPAGFR